MKKLLFNLPITGVLLGLYLCSCSDAPSTARRLRPVAPVPTAPIRYTWATAAKGPGCLPRLQDMMRWYETQAEQFSQVDYIEGQSVAGEPGDAPALPEGPYSVADGAIDDYLATLRSSGYFADHCLKTLRARATATARALERTQPPTGTLPHLEDIPVFAQNYDDMMSQKAHFVFTTEQNGRVVFLNDGDNMIRFKFDAVCKIDSISSTQLP